MAIESYGHGRMANSDENSPKSLFLASDGNIYPDSLICNGVIPAELGGHPCVYSIKGRMPDPVPLNPNDPTYSIDKGQPGDLCPPCALQKIGDLGHWQGYRGQHYPENLLPLWLFKCRMGFWLVVPNLTDEKPKER
ncbi:MAG: hypothetical protein QOH63_2175 [Acidobacteriota bacterium]|nr:hypothetical protein [Acidobacteriota bacterium]